MRDEQERDPRQAIANRNVEAILDGTERLLGRREQATIAAVAAEAGVSRPTVYAHFPDRERLLEALVERAVRNAMAAIESAEPDRGPAAEALQRLLAASWQELGRHEDIARASAAALRWTTPLRNLSAGHRRPDTHCRRLQNRIGPLTRADGEPDPRCPGRPERGVHLPGRVDAHHGNR